MAADREREVKKIFDREIAKSVIGKLAAYPEISQEDSIKAGKSLEPRLEILRDLGLTISDIELTVAQIIQQRKKKKFPLNWQIEFY